MNLPGSEWSGFRCLPDLSLGSHTCSSLAEGSLVLPTTICLLHFPG